MGWRRMSTRPIWTGRFTRRNTCARAAIGINVNDITDIRGPFGGMKMSGIGRELGQPGMDAYLETKHVRVRVREAC